LPFRTHQFVADGGKILLISLIIGAADLFSETETFVDLLALPDSRPFDGDRA